MGIMPGKDNKKMKEFYFDLQMFADAGTLVNATNGTVNAYTGAVTPSNDMTPGMKVYYDTELLENAREKQVFAQLGKKQALPANHGDTVEWRKWNTFDKAMTPLQEGVIPTGQKFGQSAINVTVKQYGDYTAVTDRLDMHHVDNVLLGATEEMGAAGGETADTLVRNELVTGTSVIYADTLNSNGVSTGAPEARFDLDSKNNRLTPDVVNKAYTFLKKQKAPRFEGNKYAAVIHPSVAYDLRSSDEWVEAHKYADVTPIFNGEIGELHGVRFIESTEAPIFKGANLFSEATADLTLAGYTGADSGSTATIGYATAFKATVSDVLTEAIAEALIGRRVNLFDASEGTAGEPIASAYICGVDYSNKYIWFEGTEDPFDGYTYASGDKLQPGEGSGDGGAVYGTMFFGKDSFGTIDPDGMGFEMIVKPAEKIGGPLNQFSTVGYKFENATKILYQERMVRVESCSAYSAIDDAN